jgi:hypothetical protein
METICLETRRALTTDPNSRNLDVLRHLSSCEACSKFSQKLKQFDDKLKLAVNIEVPEGLQSRIILAQRMDQQAQHEENNVLPLKIPTSNRDYRWMSLAAAIVLAIGLSLGMFKLGQSHGIQEEVLAHVYEDYKALEMDNNVDLVTFNTLLKPYGIQADKSIGHVRYATNCPIENKKVPHFVLEEKGVPVTVMYIPWEHSSKRVAFDDSRFKGVLFSDENGSFVILSEDPATLDLVENRVTASIETRI